MEDNYLYRCPRDLDKDLKSLVTSATVDVYIRKSSNADDESEDGGGRAVLVIEITNPNGFKNRYIIAGAIDLRRFIDSCKSTVTTIPSQGHGYSYINLHYNQCRGVTLEYSSDTLELAVVLERYNDRSISNSATIAMIPKDITKVIIDKLEAILPEYEALEKEIYDAQYNM